MIIIPDEGVDVDVPGRIPETLPQEKQKQKREQEEQNGGENDVDITLRLKDVYMTLGPDGSIKTSAVDIYDTLRRQGETIRFLSQKVDELYHAPGMPGFVLAEKSFNSYARQ